MPGPVFDHDLEMLNERSTLDEGEMRACHVATSPRRHSLVGLCAQCSVLRGTRIVPDVTVQHYGVESYVPGGALDDLLKDPRFIHL